MCKTIFCTVKIVMSITVDSGKHYEIVILPCPLSVDHTQMNHSHLSHIEDNKLTRVLTKI